MFEKYQERIITEQKELATKIVNLTTFLMSDKVSDITEEDYKLLSQQLFTMMDYHRILHKRILIFKN